LVFSSRIMPLRIMRVEQSSVVVHHRREQAESVVEANARPFLRTTEVTLGLTSLIMATSQCPCWFCTIGARRHALLSVQSIWGWISHVFGFLFGRFPFSCPVLFSTGVSHGYWDCMTKLRGLSKFLFGITRRHARNKLYHTWHVHDVHQVSTKDIGWSSSLRMILPGI
jgi:hypothetical protein